MIRAATRPAVQVFAANTGLGKTVLGAGIGRAAARDSLPVLYLKPVQTGYPEDSDSRFVQKFVPTATVKTLIAFKEAVGPHLAAQRENRSYDDATILRITEDAIREFDVQTANVSSETFVLIETAGGVHSPAISGTLQSDLYRPWRLPIVLIGDSHLGGISTTLASFEALHIRGYDVGCIMMFENPSLRNDEAIQRHIPSSIPIFTFPKPPAPLTDVKADTQNVQQWYNTDVVQARFGHTVRLLVQSCHQRSQDLASMADQAQKKFWWPFTQHQNVSSVNVIDSAYSDYFSVLPTKNSPKSLLFDTPGSWWTQGLGHGHPILTKAAAYAAGRYGHVMFPENVHQPALQLADLMLSGVGKGWASRVFFSDNGSTATEIALKMAFRLREKRIGSTSKSFKVLGLNESYHGDTIGAMLACSPNSYNKRVTWYNDQHGIWLSYPTVSMTKGVYKLTPCDTNCDCGCNSSQVTFEHLSDMFAQSRDHSPLAEVYSQCIRKTITPLAEQIGAVMIEPIVHGAGGMTLIDPLYQRVLIREAKKLGIPIIFDEVFVGCYRLGKLSTVEYLGETPDIGCYAKLLTGGLVPLALTLASEEVFDAFKSVKKIEALLHGHSYTAHAVGCQTAIAAMQQYPNSPNFDPTTNSLKPVWDEEMVRELSFHPRVQHVWALGTVLAFQMAVDKSKGSGYNAAVNFCQQLRNEEIFSRPLGSVVYFMVSPMTQPAVCSDLLRKLRRCLDIAL